MASRIAAVERFAMNRMTTTLYEYDETMVEAVADFNRRMREAGKGFALPESHLSDQYPKRPGRTIYRQHYLAIDQNSVVRGGYVLQHQEFLLGGETLRLSFLGLPISEGIINRAYSPIGVQLLRHAVQQQPFVFGLGIGGYHDPLARMLIASGWRLYVVPFYFRVVHSFRFLNNIAYLRQSATRRRLVDFLAYSGIGGLGIRAIHAGLRLWNKTIPHATAEFVEDFGDWADAVWLRNRDAYGMSAVRNAEVLRILYPKSSSRFLRIKVSLGGRPIGWAILLNTQCIGHKYFGDMRVGTIVDGFSAPENAATIIACATMWLERQGVDIIVSNQSHAEWCDGLARAGFLRGPSNFLFASSPRLAKRLAEAVIANNQTHLNRGDGDGPIHL